MDLIVFYLYFLISKNNWTANKKKIFNRKIYKKKIFFLLKNKKRNIFFFLNNLVFFELKLQKILFCKFHYNSAK
jgi:hypothetical protein